MRRPPAILGFHALAGNRSGRLPLGRQPPVTCFPELLNTLDWLSQHTLRAPRNPFNQDVAVVKFGENRLHATPGLWSTQPIGSDQRGAKHPNGARLRHRVTAELIADELIAVDAPPPTAAVYCNPNTPWTARGTI